jgi:HAD superfamily phosphoserine phosphatase-like hydrolase
MLEIAEDAWEEVLRPLVYREALDHAIAHQERGEPVWVASAALHEVVQAISDRLGFAGAIASRAESRDGVYTGRLERRLYGPEKAAAVRDLASAEGIDLRSSTAYSDSHSDGRPVLGGRRHARDGEPRSRVAPRGRGTQLADRALP